MREIVLTKGKVALVDDEDFEWINQWKWYTHKDGYAVRNQRLPGGKRKTILMHRVLVNTRPDEETDHANGNRLDNRRSNLRTCSKYENQRNQTVQKRNKSSRYKGVYWNKTHKCWISQIGGEGRGCRKKIGSFHDEEEAARAYDRVAAETFGEFAKLNFPDDDPFLFELPKVKRTSKYRGVSWSKKDKKWYSQIQHGDIHEFLGSFISEVDAAKAYNEAAKKYHKQRAILNEIQEVNGVDQSEIIKQILQERERQDKVHPEWSNNLALPVLVEELGEIGLAMQNGDIQNLKEELIQTAAVCVRWLQNFGGGQA